MYMDSVLFLLFSLSMLSACVLFIGIACFVFWWVSHLGLFINEIKNASSSQQKPIMPQKHFSRYIMGVE